jgi:hypothetical protein
MTQMVESSTPRRLPPPVQRSGLADTIILVALLAVGIGVLYFALLYGPSNNQYVRIGIWVAFLVTGLLALRVLIRTLKDYQVEFFTLPSTWLILGAAMSAVVLMFSRGNAASADFSTLDVILIAAGMVLAAISLFGNVLRTNIVFGVLLTLVQLVFSGLVIIVTMAILFGRKGHEKS